MSRICGARSIACILSAAALSIAPAQAQQAPAEGDMKPEEVYEIMIACTAYTTLAAQMAGEENTGPNRDLSARFTRASVMVEPEQSAQKVDEAVMGAVGQLIIRRMDESQKAKTDADFATLDSSCKQIDANILTPLLAEIDAKAK
jgi:hypothetical protein